MHPNYIELGQDPESPKKSNYGGLGFLASFFTTHHHHHQSFIKQTKTSSSWPNNSGLYGRFKPVLAHSSFFKRTFGTTYTGNLNI
jgi:hypothetical protein